MKIAPRWCALGFFVFVPVAVMAQSNPPTGTTLDALERPASQLNLSAVQRQAIITAIRQEGRTVKSPANLEGRVGEDVPPSAELRVLPESALIAVPEAKSLQYTVAKDQVVLVDPTKMRIVDVIRYGD